jgi:hypothetical protein
MENLKEAQADMRIGYTNGAIGVIVSGAMWLGAGFVAVFDNSAHAIWALLIGGVFIFPVSTVIEKISGKRGNHNKGNPLGALAMEGTIWMIMCLPLAYGLSLLHHEWFFQGMLMLIGGRYLTFATLYGLKLYWILGALLGGAAYLLFGLQQPANVSAFTGGVIEIVFGIVLLINFKKNTADTSL